MIRVDQSSALSVQGEVRVACGTDMPVSVLFHDVCFPDCTALRTPGTTKLLPRSPFLFPISGSQAWGRKIVINSPCFHLLDFDIFNKRLLRVAILKVRLATVYCPATVEKLVILSTSSSDPQMPSVDVTVTYEPLSGLVVLSSDFISTLITLLMQGVDKRALNSRQRLELVHLFREEWRPALICNM